MHIITWHKGPIKHFRTVFCINLFLLETSENQFKTIRSRSHSEFGSSLCPRQHQLTIKITGTDRVLSQ